MGLPERLVDRQLQRAQGDRRSRLRDLRTGQNLLSAAVVLGLLTAAFSLVAGLFEGWSWVLGVVWLGVGYVNLRQRRYVRRLLQGAAR